MGALVFSSSYQQSKIRREKKNAWASLERGS
jgi:hypothetical protein